LAAALTLTAIVAAPATASAEVRTATVADTPDPATVLLDIEQYRVRFDREAGRLTFTARLYRPWPQKATDPGTSLSAWIAPTSPDECLSAYTAGATSITIRGDYDTGAWTADYNVKFHDDYSTAPVSFSGDRREATVSFSDSVLVGADLKCVEGGASGRAAIDPSQPGGGSEYDSLEAAWFDGFAPAAPAPPGQAGTPGQNAPACSSSLTTVVGPPGRVVSGRPVAVSWHGSQEAPPVGATLTQTASGGTPSSRTFSGRGSVVLRPTIATSPLRVNLRWTEKGEYSFDEACTGERNWTVRAVRGDRPRVRVLRTDAETRTLRFAVPDSCIATRRKRITVTVRGGGRARHARLAWACGSFSARPRSLNGLWLKARGGAGVKAAELDLEAGAYGNYRRRFAVTVKGAGRTWRRHATVRSTHVSSERVYAWKPDGESNDDYWNYCVNGARQTWMHNGNAYCILPGYNDQTVSIKR
jgi:hypothetical protein